MFQDVPGNESCDGDEAMEVLWRICSTGIWVPAAWLD